VSQFLENLLLGVGLYGIFFFIVMIIYFQSIYQERKEREEMENKNRDD
jgi:hypothetical protein